MEQVFDSEESSSGCESGWTLYLQHSTPHVSHDFSWKKPHEHHEEDDEDEEDEDDDDMSMVSDASSGPPHDFQDQNEDDDDDEDEYGNNDCDRVLLTLGPRKRPKLLKQTSFHSHRHLQGLHDDTASSPFFTKDLKVCNKQVSMADDNSSDYSQGHSTTYFEMV